MIRRRPALVAVAACGVLVVAGLLWWGLAGNRSPWVPTCTDLVPVLQSELGGGWTVTDPDEYRAKSGHRSSSMCTISFVTADQKYNGTVRLFTVGAPDPEAARREVERYWCGVTSVAAARPQGYHAFRICADANTMQVHASVYAAKDDRRITTSVTINLRDDAQATAAYADDLGRLITDKALTVAEPG